ncbi:MAG: FG-GAP repeat protein [Bacteroidia bacterium]|nr:FG-GAP repeat protein [Bacteroidia bacterium]
MRDIILAIVLSFFCLLSHGQSWDWVGTQTGSGNIRANDMVTDAVGNSYVVGTFYGTADFSGNVLTNPLEMDTYVAKYDPQGNLLWVTQVTSSELVEGRAITVDGTGNAAITGRIKGTATFGATILTNTQPTFEALFTAKLDPNGSFLWARKGQGSSAACNGYGISNDNAGNYYVGGHMANTTSTFGSIMVTSTGGEEAFVVKYNSAGTEQWVRPITGSQASRVHDVVVDTSLGRLYLTGYYVGTATFGSLVRTSLSTGFEAYLAGMDLNGTFLWARTGGGTGNDWGWNVSVGPGGDVYLCGAFPNGGNFDGSALTGSGWWARYSSAGVKAFAKSITPCQDIYATTLSQVFITNPSNDTLKVFDLSGNYLTSLVNQDVYPTAISEGPDQNLHLAGQFTNTADFSPFSHVSGGGTDGFAGKFILPSCFTGFALDQVKISDTQGGFTGTLDDSDLFGDALASIGDLDHDGIPDLVSTAQWDDDGGTDRGAVYVLFMNASGTVKSQQKISSTQGNFSGLLDDLDWFGIDVEHLGDLDGDGNPDLAVGAAQDDDGGSNRGAVWILFLNADGTVKSHQKISDTQGGLAATLDDNDSFGSSVANLGDLDGDGVIDLAVGARWDDDGGVDFGAVYVLFLNANGTVKAEQKISSTTGGLGAGLGTGDWFGNCASPLGDLDGDGTEDLVVGALRDDDGGTDRGAVYILLLNPNGTVKAQQKVSDTQGGFTGLLDDLDSFGKSCDGLGDLDGDGINDLAVGAWQDDDGNAGNGAVYILLLQNNGTVKAFQKISSTQGGPVTGLNGSSFGSGLAWMGDFDGDHVTEIAVGGRNDDDGGPDRGAFWILDICGQFVFNCPLATFNPDNQFPCPGDSVHFTNVSAYGNSFQWLVNGQVNANSTHFATTFTQPGNYQITLIATDTTCADTLSRMVYVGAPLWTDLVGVVTSADTLHETVGSNSWGTKGAASTQILQPNEDGGIIHVVSSLKEYYYFGLSNGNADAGPGSIGHAFYVKKNKLEVREASGTNIAAGTLTAGDTLAILRQGANLFWLKNGIPVYTTVANAGQWLLADVSLFKANSYLTHTWLTFCETSLPLAVNGSVEHDDCINSPAGMVMLTVSGGTPPYSYLWSTGDTTPSVDSLPAGMVSVTVSDNGGGMQMLSFSILNRLSWQDEVGAVSSVDTLSRTLGGMSWNTCGARSVQVLAPNTDGDFTHVIHQTDKYYYVGLSVSNSSLTQLDLDYAFYVAKSSLKIREANGYFANHGTIGLLDTLRIERVGTQIRYYKNSTLLKSTPVSASQNLFVDATLYNSGTSLYDNFISFCTDSLAPDSFYASLTSVTHEDCFQSNGGAQVMAYGGVPPYSYLWSSSETTAAISGKAPGLYTCTVSDQNNMNQVISVEILSKIVWEGFIGSSAQGDTLMNINSSNGWGTSGARSDNKALNGSDGKVVHVVNSISKNYYLGLSDADPDASQFTIDYAFYNNKGNLYIREEKTGFFQNYGTVAVGDTLVVERRISSMYWYQNGNLLRSIGISPTETLRVDVSMFSVGTEIYDTWVDFCDTVPGQKRGQAGSGSSLAAHGSELLLFPNPGPGRFQLVVPEKISKFELKVFSANGVPVFTLQNLPSGRLELNLDHLSEGIYFLVLTSSETTEYAKFSVQK